MKKLGHLVAIAVLGTVSAVHANEPAKAATPPAAPAAAEHGMAPAAKMAPAGAATTAPAAHADATAKVDLVDTVLAAGNFKTLVMVLTEADLVKTLKGPGPFTVFAPTDEAFAKLPKAELDALLKDKAKLKKVLTYHVVKGNLQAADIMKMKDGSKVKTDSGKSFVLGLKGGKVMVDSANVTKTDIEASNGVIHVIDTVIIPK